MWHDTFAAMSGTQWQTVARVTTVRPPSDELGKFTTEHRADVDTRQMGFQKMPNLDRPRTLLLQSGGIDSAAAALNLLEAGHEVVALTLAKDAANHVLLPKKRAVEIFAKHPGYSWAMADISTWDALLEKHVKAAVDGPVPVSCLICILAKITAVVPYCRENEIASLAVGYTAYQSEWAEQTSDAIGEQRTELRRLGISLLLPSAHYEDKKSVVADLSTKALTAISLENPCCISEIGTQPTQPHIVKQVVRTAFMFLAWNNPAMEVVDTVGEFPT